MGISYKDIQREWVSVRERERERENEWVRDRETEREKKENKSGSIWFEWNLKFEIHIIWQLITSWHDMNDTVFSFFQNLF